MKSRFYKASLVLLSGVMVQSAMAQEATQQTQSDAQAVPVAAELSQAIQPIVQVSAQVQATQAAPSVVQAPILQQSVQQAQPAAPAQPTQPTPEELAAMTPRQQLEAKLKVEPAYEAPAGMLFDEQAYLSGQTPISDFENVIVINKKAKGPGAQTMRVYTNHQLVLTTKVSTGQEGIEYVSPVASFFRHFGKGAVKSHWRHTTRGFYSVKRVENADYKSGENNFEMPYAMFFNEDKGLAIHQAPPDIPGDENELGHNVSSGCVRVSKNVIYQIWSAVTGADKGKMPVIDSKTGQQLTDSSGNPRFTEGYRTLVIVEEY